jgi:transcriptional regulator with XRE-family HTH domain
MATLQHLLKGHLETRNLSVKTLAERLAISYPTVLALVNKGSLPRSQEHREILRRELGLSNEAWATVLASSMRDGIEIPAEGPLTLQQLVTKAMLSQGYTEQSLAEKTGLPYPTLLGITRKGSIPRGETLPRLASALKLDVREVEAAVALSRDRRVSPTSVGEEDGVGEDEAQPTDSAGPNLAQLTLDAVTRSGTSTAAFAKQHGIPYLSLMRLIRDGIPPVRGSALTTIKAALGLDEAGFESALDRSKADPQPASRSKANEIASNPLQASLLKLVEERGLSVKAFAALADLSVLTATRLLKKGDLPGRQATHAKLRGLLGISDTEYQLLLQRARASGASESEDDEAQPQHLPSITETFNRQQAAITATSPAPVDEPIRAGSFTEAFAAKVPREPSDEDFMVAIRRLGPKQRRALMGFIATLAG